VVSSSALTTAPVPVVMRTKIADLRRGRNVMDVAIAEIIGRPMTSGHLGEWIAAQVFDVELMDSAAEPAIDGRFRSGPLTVRTVNVKWYLKQEGLLDLTESAVLDYYLVLTGPRSGAVTSRQSTRPWRIDTVYLFDASELLAQQHRPPGQDRHRRQRPQESTGRR
jgi:hypothetical protein